MKTVMLNNGVVMPQIGYGVYQVTPAECERCVSDALKTGYRMIDTAQAYHNEEGVGSAGRSNNFFTNPVLESIGKKYGKSVAQVALRWLLQRDVIIIPKSTHIERMEQNLDILDFALSNADMAEIARLDTGKSLFFDHHDPEVVKRFMGWR